MNRVIRITTLTVFALILTSCATFHAQRSDLVEQIDIWQQQHRYDKALAIIELMSPEHPDYKKLQQERRRIESRRAQYVDRVLKQAASFTPSQDWLAAEKVIDQALKNLPDDPKLSEQHQVYIERRGQRILMDEAAIIIARAEFIINARPYQESRLYNADNRFFAQQQFNSFLDEANQTSRELFIIGERYWQERKYPQARQALTLANQTANNPKALALLAELNNFEKDERTQARKKQQKELSELVPELERSFHERLSYRDFLGAQKILNEMSSLDLPQTQGLQQRLNSAKSERVNQLVTSGNTLYNSGYIQEAIQRWEQALLLEPKNTLVQQQLERAEKFLNNLERWKANNAP